MTRITIVAPFLAALLVAAPGCSKKDDASPPTPLPQAVSKTQEAEKAAQAEKAGAQMRTMIIAETWRNRNESPGAGAGGDAKDSRAGAAGSSATTHRRVARAPVLEKGERVVGDPEDIKLSNATARKMDFEGDDKLAILAKLCLDVAGTPSSATIVESSGYPQADKSVRDEIMAWEYEPYTVDGNPVPFCELLTFRLSLLDGPG